MKMKFLPFLLSNGDGTASNKQESIAWYKKAAEQNHPKAQFYIGAAYYKGNSVRQDKKISKNWFGKACKNGHKKGCDIFSMLEEQGY